MKALGFAIAIALGATAAAGQDRPTNDQLIGYFETVVFGNEVPGREATIIRKWDGVIRYKFGGITAVVERSRGAAEAHMATPDAFFEFAIRGDCGGRPWRADDNLGLRTRPGWRRRGWRWLRNRQILWEPRAPDAFFLATTTPGGALQAARIIINSDNIPEVVEHCLVEEITQALGLPNDDPGIIPSIFNDTLQLDALSFIDQVLVRVLYDPRLLPGTPRVDAIAIARAILEELNPGG